MLRIFSSLNTTTTTIINIIIITIFTIISFIHSTTLSSAVSSRDFIRYAVDRDDDDVCMMGVVIER
jgi:hypothetical protein